MNKKIPSALGKLPVDVPTPEEKLFSNLMDAVLSIGARMAHDPDKKERIKKISYLIQYLKESLNGNNPSWAALVSFNLAQEIYDFDEQELEKALKSDMAKMAANSRHTEKQDQYAHALAAVSIHLDSDTYPDWKHADYVNWIMSQERYTEISRDSLKEKIVKLFKGRGLDARISKGPAMHFK